MPERFTTAGDHRRTPGNSASAAAASVVRDAACACTRSRPRRSRWPAAAANRSAAGKFGEPASKRAGSSYFPPRPRRPRRPCRRQPATVPFPPAERHARKEARYPPGRTSCGQNRREIRSPIRPHRQPGARRPAPHRPTQGYPTHGTWHTVRAAAYSPQAHWRPDSAQSCASAGQTFRCTGKVQAAVPIQLDNAELGPPVPADPLPGQVVGMVLHAADPDPSPGRGAPGPAPGHHIDPLGGATGEYHFISRSGAQKTRQSRAPARSSASPPLPADRGHDE